MDEREPAGPVSIGETPIDAESTAQPASEARVGAKCAFFDSLDTKLAAAGYAVTPRAPAPPPPSPPLPAPPALSFETWAEMSVRLSHASLEELEAALSARGLSFGAWMRLDADYERAISDDLRAGRTARPAIYKAKYQEERVRRGELPLAPALCADDPAPALDTFRRTDESPDLPAAIMVAIGKVPFTPPSPQEPAAPGKRPAKTVPSKVVPSGAGQTMPLDAGALPIPILPFAGSAGSAGVVPVPDLTASQYVALRVELMLEPAPRDETLRRYLVPTEAAYRAIEERWRKPARRVELEVALATLGTWLHNKLLG